MPGFDVFVGLRDEIGRRCVEDGIQKLRQTHLTDRHLLFPPDFSASEVLQLGAAVTTLTGVREDFGSDDDRIEPDGCLFVDRLTRQWVAAASQLSLDMAEEIERRWVAACLAAEGEKPVWAAEPQSPLLVRFLQLCKVAASEESDLVMVWEL